jgi:group I intron endonuclease
MKVILESFDVQPVIYGIRNKVNNKIYVGKAKNYFSRFSMHLRDLQLRKHYCKLLQSDFDLYGKSNFQFLIIRELQTGEDIDFLEIEEISKIDSTLLYNSNLVENKVVSYNPTTGEVLKVYFNISDASRQTGIPFINIYLCCTEYNSTKTAKNIGFIFEENKDKIQSRLIHKNTGRKNTSKVLCKKINVYDKLGNKLYEFNSLTDAANQLNLHFQSISNCLNGRSKSTGGYTFKYA